MERLKKQLEFLVEIDKLKTIMRRNYISSGSKRENDAEQSWYFAMAALLLAEHANKPIDVNKVIRMALIHDIVEADAGDTFIYDEQAIAGQQEREEKAAARLFGILPDDQKEMIFGLWNEFEENKTDDALFARAIDRFVAVFLNCKSGGKTWHEHNISYERVYQINEKIKNGSVDLWVFVQELINDAAAQGILKKGI